ncbi:MAG: TonB family protein [Tannerella sp.]|jgi:TonB family protein|nr:TonB family protein [Tannerella sp.]
MEFDKNKLIALIGAIAFHLAIFLILLYSVITTLVAEEETGVLVNFGTVELSAGLYEPRGSTSASGQSDVSVPAVPPTRTSTPPRSRPAEEMITQDSEESIAIANQRRADEERRQREDAERRENERLAAEQRRQQEEQRKREQDIQNRVAGAFGIGNADADSQGSGTAGAGNEGSPFGNSDTGQNTGVGGFGGSFNLSGRSIRGGGLPRPDYTSKDEGVIVVNITVDPRGDVIMSEIGRGTNIDNASMRSSALEAAKRAKFNSIAGTNNQSGTITYRYTLK